MRTVEMVGARIHGFAAPGVRPIGPEAVARTAELAPVPEAFPNAFTWLFEPVLSHMASLYWFAHWYENAPFFGDVAAGYEDWEERWATAVVELADPPEAPEWDRSGEFLFRPYVLPGWAPYLRDDWIHLIGFAAGSDTAAIEVGSRFLSSSLRSGELGGEKHLDEYCELLSEHADLCFMCIDGFAWEMYAKERELVDRVVARASSIEGLKIDRISLDESWSVGLDERRGQGKDPGEE
jgi:hypothetical protein